MLQFKINIQNGLKETSSLPMVSSNTSSNEKCGIGSKMKWMNMQKKYYSIILYNTKNKSKTKPKIKFLTQL